MMPTKQVTFCIFIVIFLTKVFVEFIWIESRLKTKAIFRVVLKKSMRLCVSSKNVLREHVYSLNDGAWYSYVLIVFSFFASDSFSVSLSFFVPLCGFLCCQNDFQCMIRAEVNSSNMKRACRRDIEFNSF